MTENVNVLQERKSIKEKYKGQWVPWGLHKIYYNNLFKADDDLTLFAYKNSTLLSLPPYYVIDVTVCI